MQSTYTGEDVRDYDNVDGSSLRATPGQTYELSTAPDDGRWTNDTPNLLTPVEPVNVSEIVGTADATVVPPETTGA